jgi:hypothetical protein
MPKRDGSDVTCSRIPAERGKGEVCRAGGGGIDKVRTK